MNLKTILLLICLFSALLITHQATADEAQVEAGSSGEKESLLDSAKRIQEKSLDELKNQAKRAKDEFKSAYKKLKKSIGSDSSDSSDSSEAPAENESSGIADEAERKIQEKAIELLTNQARKAKQQFKAALKKLKKSSDTSDSSSDSESQDQGAEEAQKEEGGIIDRAKEFAKRKSIEELQEQALKAKEELRAAWNKWRGKSSDAGSSGDNNVADSEKESGGLIDKAEEKIKQRSIEELKKQAMKAKEELKTALKDRLKGNKGDDSDSSSDSSTSDLFARVRKTAQGAWDSVTNRFSSQEKGDAEL